MKLLFAKPLFTAALLLALSPAQAATQDLDKLLSSIKDDIAAKRLSSPAGNNALERIDAFREQAPFDLRVVPLAYQWGSAYVDLADKAIAAKEYDKAQSYLDKVWQVAALTPGLEDTQAKLDAVYKGAPVAARAEEKESSKEELERQKKLADAAAKEKARIEAERKRKQEEDKRQAAAEKKKAEEERARKQEEERQRRAEAEQAEKAAAAKRVADAKKANDDKQRADVAAAKKPAEAKKPEPAKVKMVAAAKPAAGGDDVSKLWSEAKETSAPIASYPVSQEMISNRDRDIVESLQPMCQAILDNDASVVIHSQDKADYRWLTVRLTLCMRRLDKTFRLRHSYQAESDGEPFVTLHPPREVSLVREVTE